MSDLFYLRIQNWLLTSPPAEWVTKQLRDILIGALRQGPIPRHVAFEMDGNRRYARSHKIETVEGHHLGFEALARVLEICYKCGVTVVTVYAFSIENFNRPKYEVDGLMQLAKLKLEQIVQHGEILERYGARVCILGRRDLLDPDVLQVMDRAVDMTKHNSRAVLNICFPYTSREEITSAVKATVEEYSTTQQRLSSAFSQSRITQKIRTRQSEEDELLAPVRESSPARSDDPEDSVSSSTTLMEAAQTDLTIFPNVETITVETIDRHMYTAGCPPLDLFVRTSGVERLSDFMLWQCHQQTHIVFLKCFWPEFDLGHFLPVLVEWQRKRKQRESEERPSKKER